MTTFISSVPIVPARDVEAAATHCQERDIVHPNAPLREQPWGFREFGVIDRDGNLVTFFEPPSDQQGPK
jgi:hypothetical protein